MKIHTNTLTRRDFEHALPEGTWLYECREADFGSRTHDRAFQVRLSGSHKVALSGVVGVKAATYEEWGEFLARLFQFDPAAKCGNYKTAEDFNRQTNYAFGD
jgi:hypothetical protein